MRDLGPSGGGTETGLPISFMPSSFSAADLASKTNMEPQAGRNDVRLLRAGGGGGEEPLPKPETWSPAFPARKAVAPEGAGEGILH